ELMNHAVRPRQMPIRVGLVPHAVKPHAAEFSVIRQQLAQLPVHEVQISIPVSRIRPPRAMARPAAWKIIFRMPIELRVIHKQLDSLLMTFRRQHADDVFPVRRARRDVPVRQLGIEHRESELTEDRKRTRLNSSHRTISYAVFCLKKKISHLICGVPRCPLSYCWRLTSARHIPSLK